MARRRCGVSVEIDPTHNGYGVRGTVQDGNIIVNRAFVGNGDTLQQVLREEHNHALLSSDDGRAFLRYAAGYGLGDFQYSTLAKQYPRQLGESVADWKARMTDEFIAKAASKNIPVWQQIVERVKSWLARKGIGRLTDEETGRAIMRALKSGETASEFAPRLLDVNRSDDDVGWGTDDESDFGDSTQENNSVSRYNLTAEPLEGMSQKRAADAINELFGTKQLPAAIRVVRNSTAPDAVTIRPRGAIAVNAARISRAEEATQAVLRGGLGHIWYEPEVQRAWQRVRSDITPAEMAAALNRRQAQGLRTDFGIVQEHAAITRLIKSDGLSGVVGRFHNAVRTVLKEKFNLNVPAKAHLQLNEAAIQFLRNRTQQAPGLGLAPKGMIPLGQWGETWLSHVLSGAGIKPTIPMKTSLTFRFVDRHVKKMAHESKAGLNVKLHDRMRTQILKDADLIRSGKIDGAHWHFFRGAQADVLKFLEQNAIGYTVY